MVRGKRVLMIVAPKDFRDEEFLEPKGILEKSGANVTVASKGTTVAIGTLGSQTKIDIDIKNVNIEDYDAVIFVGGTGSSIYFNDIIALSIAKKAFEKNKVIGAICIAPSILANAGIVKGKKVTSYPSEKNNLIAKEAEYTGADVEQDKNIITANGPQSASKFGKKILESLK